MKNQHGNTPKNIEENTKSNLSYHTPTFEFLNYLSELNNTENPIKSYKTYTEKYTIHNAADYFT